MKISAIREAFADEWVAAEVLGVDKADVPLAGEVITHSPDKQEVYQAVQAYLARRPTARTFIFFTGQPIPEGLGVALALRRPNRGRLACCEHSHSSEGSGYGHDAHQNPIDHR